MTSNTFPLNRWHYAYWSMNLQWILVNIMGLWVLILGLGANIAVKCRWHINPCWAEFILGNYIRTFAFSIISQHRDGSWNVSSMQLKSFLVKYQDPFLLHSQCHGCWCPDDARSWGISSLSIDLVYLEYFSFTTRKFKSAWWKKNNSE